MKVSELITKLQEMPQDMNVYLSDTYEDFAMTPDVVVVAQCESDGLDTVNFYNEAEVKELQELEEELDFFTAVVVCVK